MNRANLQRLSDLRIQDAEALLAAGQSSAAYYLVGYAVECALKAAILLRIERTGIIFAERKFADACWTHDLHKLMRLAGLEVEFGEARANDADLRQSWLIVSAWTEESRYATWSAGCRCRVGRVPRSCVPVPCRHRGRGLRRSETARLPP